MTYEGNAWLENSRPCVMHHAAEADAGAILRFLRYAAGDGNLLPFYPDEIRDNVEEAATILRTYEAHPRKLILLMEHYDELFAVCSMEPVGESDRLRHRAAIRLAILRGSWTKETVGTIFFVLDGLAKEAGYLQMELEAAADDTGVTALLYKSGFRLCGTRQRAYRERDGQFRNVFELWRTIV